jgi:hypothetical protein
MKRHSILVLQLMVTVILIASLSGCDKEKVTQTYTWYTPNYSTLTEVRANMKSSPARALKDPGKIYIYGNYIFLNEVDEGIHIFDNSQPTSPKRISFIPIPGNVDIAVTGNTLYADSYCDLVTFDISDPKAVTPLKFTENAFPYRSGYLSYNRYAYNTPRPTNTDSIKVVVSYTRHDTVYSHAPNISTGPIFFDALASSSVPSKSTTGQGGSMARFTLMDNHLYTVSTSELLAYNISNPRDPQFVKKTTVGASIETIYPFKNKLFIGSSFGMYIYDVSAPGSPVKLGQLAHFRSCDPVVADDNKAWVTLRSGVVCGGNINQLQVVDITNLMSPSLVKTYNMTNPFGLGKDGNTLFICDGKDGVKVYNAADANNLMLIKRIDGLQAYDVIASNNRALVVAKEGLYQFDYSNLGNIRLLSKIVSD